MYKTLGYGKELTVSDLRKALKGVKGNLPIYLADHDHGNYETNGHLHLIAKVRQSKDIHKSTNLDEDFKINGTYIVLQVG